MTSKARPIPKKRSRRLAVAVVVLAIALIGAWLAITSSGRSALEAATNRVAVAGLPLLPADIKPAKDRTGQDPAAWFARVANAKNLWDMRALSVPSTYRPLLESARRREFGEDARVAFEQFQASMEKLTSEEKDPLASWSAFWTVLDKLLRESDGTSDWGDAPENALRLLSIGLEPSMQIAREAKDYGPIDPAQLTAQLDAANEGFPRLLVVQELGILDAVQANAIYHAQSQQYAKALDDVRAGLAVARIHRPSCLFVGNMLWTVDLQRTLDILQAILPMLPRQLDVADIEAELTAMMPRQEMAAAIAGERAFGNRVYEHMSHGDYPADKAAFATNNPLWRAHWALVRDWDRAAYLDAMGVWIDRLAKPAYLRAPLASKDPNSWWAPMASIITPVFSTKIGLADQLEARLALARAALASYRGGAPAAFTFLATSIDPFDGRTLRSATGDGGFIAFWSIGPDLKDDGAKDRALDIVWTLKLRE
jgi:hypothetical protein